LLVSRPIARRLGVLVVGIADVIEENIIRRLLGNFLGGHAHLGGVGGQLAGEVFEPLAAARLVLGHEIGFWHMVLAESMQQGLNFHED
jgi:hypothetical protein